MFTTFKIKSCIAEYHIQFHLQIFSPWIFTFLFKFPNIQHLQLNQIVCETEKFGNWSIHLNSKYMAHFNQSVSSYCWTATNRIWLTAKSDTASAVASMSPRFHG